MLERPDPTRRSSSLTVLLMLVLCLAIVVMASCASPAAKAPQPTTSGEPGSTPLREALDAVDATPSVRDDGVGPVGVWASAVGSVLPIGLDVGSNAVFTLTNDFCVADCLSFTSTGAWSLQEDGSLKLENVDPIWVLVAQEDGSPGIEYMDFVVVPHGNLLLVESRDQDTTLSVLHRVGADGDLLAYEPESPVAVPPIESSDVLAITITEAWPELRIFYAWAVPPLRAPMEASFLLKPATGDFVGTADFSLEGYTAGLAVANAVTRSVAIDVPLPVISDSLALLESTPLEAGTYRPTYPFFFTLYPAIRFVLESSAGDIQFLSQSQDPRHVPWEVVVGQDSYVTYADTPQRVLELLDPYLARDLQQELLGEGTCTWDGSIRVWLDVNENGVWDQDEAPLAEIPVTVDDTNSGHHGVGYAESDLTGTAHPSVEYMPCSRDISFRVRIDPDSRFRSTTAEAVDGIGPEDSGPYDFGLAYASEVAPTVTPLPRRPVAPVLACQSHNPLGDSGQIEDIEILPSGEVWVASGSGVARFDPETESWEGFTAADGLVPGDIWRITPDPDGSLWIVTRLGEVGRFDGETWRQYTRADGLIADHVLQVSIAPDGSVWFVSLSGVSRWDREVDSWTVYGDEGADGLPNIFAPSADVLFTPDGRVWFSTGVTVASLLPASVSGDDDVWEAHPGPCCPATVAPDGNTWFAGERFYDVQQGRWFETVYEGGPLGFVLDLAVDRGGGLWIAEGYDVVYIANPLATPQDCWTVFGEDVGIRGGAESIALEGDEVWFGTSDATAMRCQITWSD